MLRCSTLLAALAIYASPAAQHPFRYQRRAINPDPSTSAACLQIAMDVSDTVAKSLFAGVDPRREQAVLVDIAVAGDCIKSIPLKKDDADLTIGAILRSLQLQSNVPYFKAPLVGNVRRLEVDLEASLWKIRAQVMNDEIKTQYDLEIQLNMLLAATHDSHLNWQGSILMGMLLSWTRPTAVSLASVSADGIRAPNPAFAGRIVDNHEAEIPDSIIEINGVEATFFLAAESQVWSISDEHTGYNAMFYQHEIAPGGFITPIMYPGEWTNFTFASGVTSEWRNLAWVKHSLFDDWMDVAHRGKTMYDTFVSTSPRDMDVDDDAPEFLSLWHNLDTLSNSQDDVDTILPFDFPDELLRLRRRNVPYVYSATNEFHVVAFPSGEKVVWLKLSSLSLTDFNGNPDPFWIKLPETANQIKQTGATKLFIDVRNNGGGHGDAVLLFLWAFFPQLRYEPVGARFRATRTLRVFGDIVDNHWKPEWGRPGHLMGIMQPGFFKDSDTGETFDSWSEMLSGLPGQSDEVWSRILESKVIPNHAAGAENIFEGKNVVLISDGTCNSACATFYEQLRAALPGVIMLALGGLPTVVGPMPMVAQSRGAGLQTVEKITKWVEKFRAAGLLDDFTLDSMPFDPPIRYHATVNTLDMFAGAEKNAPEPVPLQFRYFPANCRVFLTKQMYRPGWLDHMIVFVNDVAFGGEGGKIDQRRCVQGSYFPPMP